MREKEEALEALWDCDAGSCYSCDVRTGDLLREQSVAALMPLYSGCISLARARHPVGVRDFAWIAALAIDLLQAPGQPGDAPEVCQGETAGR